MLERIYVEIGNICNLSCAFCMGTSREKRQISEREFEEICKKIKSHTKYIYLHVMGEPLLHPLLDRFLAIARDNELPVCITTNGTLLKKSELLLLENSDIVHKVSISLHSVESNGGTELEKYLENATAFAKKAAKAGMYVVFRLWNMDSAEGQGQNCCNSGIEEYLHSEFTNEWQKRPRGYRLGTNVFLEYDGVFTWPASSTADEIEEGFCHALSAQVAILADGTVVPCCLDANGDIPLGNIFESSLEEILKGSRALDMKNGLACGRFSEVLCRKCTFARKFKKRGR